jgi:hypothetical protein
VPSTAGRHPDSIGPTRGLGCNGHSVRTVVCARCTTRAHALANQNGSTGVYAGVMRTSDLLPEPWAIDPLELASSVGPGEPTECPAWLVYGTGNPAGSGTHHVSAPQSWRHHSSGTAARASLREHARMVEALAPPCNMPSTAQLGGAVKRPRPSKRHCALQGLSLSVRACLPHASCHNMSRQCDSLLTHYSLTRSHLSPPEDLLLRKRRGWWSKRVPLTVSPKRLSPDTPEK